jgi:AcrR family transcriptional regulator
MADIAPQEETLLTRQGRRTRAALVRAARRTFERRGYRDTRIADITRAADVSIGTFYTYFGSKEAIFKEVLDDLAQRVYAAHDTPTDGQTPRERIATTNQRYFDTFQRNAKMWATVEEAAIDQPDARRVLSEYHARYRARAQRAFKSWQEQGIIAPHVDTDFAALALGAMTERLAYQWFLFGEPYDPEQIVDQVTTMWVDGIGLRDTASPPRADPPAREARARRTR